MLDLRCVFPRAGLKANTAPWPLPHFTGLIIQRLDGRVGAGLWGFGIVDIYFLYCIVLSFTIEEGLLLEIDVIDIQLFYTVG